MKHKFKLAAAAAMILAFSAFAYAEETPAAEQEKKEIKTGWNFGPCPALSYSSDLGLQMGALCDIFYYGDGSTYPSYMHKMNVEASYFTKGSFQLHYYFDSKYLIPGNIRFTGAVTYKRTNSYGFFGYNGAAGKYISEFDGNKDFDFGTGLGFGNDFLNDHGLNYYAYQRDMFRVLADFQGKIAGEHFKWGAGLAFWKFGVDNCNLKNYSNNSISLYNDYVNYGLINDDEKNGGTNLEFKAGLVYDSRNHEAAPRNGIWAELYLSGSPDMFSANHKYNYLRLHAHWRQYIPLLDEKIVFAYHLAYQGKLAGEVPFYMQQNITTMVLRQMISEGLGSTNTFRGTRNARFIADGYAWANFEMRFRICQFDFINQHWYIATNPFFDIAKVVQPYRLDAMHQAAKDMYADRGYQYISNVIDESKPSSEWQFEDECLHMSAGLGFKLAMNRNFIITLEVAKPFRKQDNDGIGLNIGLGYIF